MPCPQASSRYSNPTLVKPRSATSSARAGPWTLSLSVARKRKSLSAATASCGDDDAGEIWGMPAGPVMLSATAMELVLE